MHSDHDIPSNTLAIALGANIPSSVGSPYSTLIAVRPLLEKVICEWIASTVKENIDVEQILQKLLWRWSPIYETEAIGGPTNQPNFLNAVLIVDGPKINSLEPSEQAILNLLKMTLDIEKSFGRERNQNSIKWGPRCIDIDLLAWGELHMKNEILTLPHPRLISRNFVIIPLAAALNKREGSLPIRLPQNKDWKE